MIDNNIVKKAAENLAINLKKKLEYQQNKEFDSFYVFVGVGGFQNERYGWECLLSNKGIGLISSSIDFDVKLINVDTNVPLYGLYDSKSKIYELGLLKQVAETIYEYLQLPLENVEMEIVEYTLICKVKNESSS